MTLSVEAIQRAHEYVRLCGYYVTKKQWLKLWGKVYDREITIP